MQQLPKRLLSIDVLRAITMLLMIFVNDASGVRHIPEWIDHTKRNDDAMGFADTIFPAFLFIVGLSLPFAINNRIKKGDTALQVIFYIVIRSAALLIMGFYHVNLENFNSASVIPRAIWALVITFSFFLIWLDYPETMNKAKKYSLMGAGVVLLIVMTIFYKGGHDEPHGMRPSWWGILGIIGWSYLVCALLFFVAKGKLNLLILFWVFLAGVNIAVHLTLLPKGGLWIIKDASSTTLVMGGIVISGIYSMLVQQGKTQRLWYILAALGIALIAVGFLIRPYAQGISKIRSTPAWVFICSGITILVFEMLVYAVDFKGKKDWFKIIAPAGTSTLTCYLMPYFQVYLMELFMINYPSVLNNGLPGLMRSFATGLILIAIVGLMEKKRLRLKI